MWYVVNFEASSKNQNHSREKFRSEWHSGLLPFSSVSFHFTSNINPYSNTNNINLHAALGRCDISSLILKGKIPNKGVLQDGRRTAQEITGQRKIKERTSKQGIIG